MKKSTKSQNLHNNDMEYLINQINNLEEGQFIKLHFDDEDINSRDIDNDDDDDSYEYNYDSNDNTNSDSNINGKFHYPSNLKLIKHRNFRLKEKITDNSFVSQYLTTNRKGTKIYLTEIFRNKKYFHQELNVYSQIESQFILKFVGYHKNDFKKKNRPIIITIMPKNGSLNLLLKSQRNGFSFPEFNDTKKLILIYGIASVMSHLHKQNITHRNLKPSCIYLDKFLFPKIGGFCFSIQNVNHSKSEKDDVVGTYAYMAPEVITEQRYSSASDVYSYAFVIYEILTSKKPFSELNEIQLIEKVLSGYRPQIDQNVPDCYRNLIERCWSDKPQKRPSFAEIVTTIKTNPNFVTDSCSFDEFVEFVRLTEGKATQSKAKGKKSSDKDSIDLKIAEKIGLNDQNENEGFLNLSLFEKQDQIVKGEFSKIRKVKSKETATIYAAKISMVEINKLNEKEKVLLQSEVKVISSLHHPSLFLELVGFSPLDFHQRRKPVIVSELAKENSSLEQLFESERKSSKNSKWNDTKKLIAIYAIAAEMAVLHSYQIVHRNLTPRSVFVDENLMPKIGNFGLLTRKIILDEMIFESVSGIDKDYFYLSPEILSKREFSQAGDVYAFSLIVYEIITNKTPFEEVKNLTFLLNEVVKNSYRPKFQSPLSKSYQDLIENCWSQNQGKRPTFDEITRMLKSEKGFITEKVNIEEFNESIQKIEKMKSELNSKIQNILAGLSNNNSALKDGNREAKNAQYQENEADTKTMSKCCYLI